MTISQKTSVSSHRLNHLAEQLERRSGDSGAVNRALKSADLSEDDLGRDGHRIDAHKEARFLQAAVAIVEDTSFAAVAGLNFTKNTGLPAYVGKYSEDLRDAIENAERYLVLMDPISSFKLMASSNSASFIYSCGDAHLSAQPRYREFLTFTSLAVMRDITQRDFHPLEIRFQHSAPSAKSALERLAGCPIVFDAEETEIILAPSTLRLPIPAYDPTLLRYLKGYGDGLLAQLKKPEPDLRARIEALLVDNLPGRILPAPEVAASLGMGHRTFSRRLAEEGLSFSTIVEELRGSLAKNYLTQSKTPISEIAFLLDYSDQAAFTTAFKRWTGATPKAFRAEGVAG